MSYSDSKFVLPTIGGQLTLLSLIFFYFECSEVEGFEIFYLSPCICWKSWTLFVLKRRIRVKKGCKCWRKSTPIHLCKSSRNSKWAAYVAVWICICAFKKKSGRSLIWNWNVRIFPPNLLSWTVSKWLTCGKIFRSWASHQNCTARLSQLKKLRLPRKMIESIQILPWIWFELT